MTDQELEEERKKIMLNKAIREEIAEMILRYVNGKLDPESIANALFAGSMKVNSALSACMMAQMKKKGVLDDWINAITKDLKKSAQEEDKEES